MASYDASINVRVSGTAMVDGVINRVQELERLVKTINTKPLNLSKVMAEEGAFGRANAQTKEMATRLNAATLELNSLKKSFVNNERAVEAFGTTAGRTVANTTALARAFKQIADNSDITTNQFREFTVAAQQAAVAANTLGRARLTVLAEELTGGTRDGGIGKSKTIGGATLVDELIDQRKAVSGSISSLNAYQSELRDLQQLVLINSEAYWKLERAILSVDKALNRTKIPAFPPPPTTESTQAKKSTGGVSRLESIALGVGFPLLFGGGAGEVLGSFAGSFVGQGFGGQIFGGAIGGILDEFATKASKIGIALNPVTKDIDGLVTALGGSATAAGRYITKLEELGRTQESLSAAADELARIVGAEGVDALKLFGDDAAQLGVLFSQAMLQMQASVAALINSSGILRTILKAVEYNVLLKQALASKDPGLQKLQKEREKAGRPGFLGGSPAQVYALNDKLVEQQSRLNAAKIKQYDIETLNLVKQKNYFDILKETANLAEQVAKAREAASDKVRSAQIQELEQQKQIAMTAQAELSAINSIYAQKKQGIDVAYAATKREADLKVQLAAIDLASAKRDQEQGKATAEEAAKAAEAVSGAQKVYDAAVATTQETLRGAAATQSAATSAADLERRQQTVTAYTRQFADEAARASNKLNEAANAASTAASVTQALAQAEITINNVRIQSLQNSLAETQNASQRANIIEQIRKLEINNAVATLNATRAQIAAELARQEIAYRQVQLKYQELQATVSIAKAQGLMNRDYATALENQASALRIAKQNVQAGKQIADANNRAANAVYRGAVEAANLKAQTTQAAGAAGKFAASMERGAQSMQRAAGITVSGSSLEPWMEAKIAMAKEAAIKTSSDPFTSYIRGINAEIELRQKFENILTAQRTASNTQAEQDFWTQASSLGFGKFASGGYVTGPTLGLVGEGGEPEYIIPQSKMATAASNYLSGGRGAGIMEGGGGGSAPSVNITTGPVIEFNGERYVTMRDMERGLQQMAANIYSGLRTPSGRYATGVR